MKPRSLHQSSLPIAFVFLLLCQILLVLCSRLAGAAPEQSPRKNPAWQELVAKAKEALTHDCLADARDLAFEAQHIGDTAEVSALLATALHGLGLISDDVAEITHAALMAERCLQQLDEPDPELDPDQRNGVRLTCLAMGARAYHRFGNQRLAHDYAVQCMAQPARSPAAIRMQRPCKRIFEDTEREGFGVLGGTWWKYLIVNGQAGYSFRYFPGAPLHSPSQRLDGATLEVAVGYPNFSLGPVLLRPEAVLRWESDGDEFKDDGVQHPSAASVMAIGARMVLTYPSRFLTLDLGLGVMASELRSGQTPQNAVYVDVSSANTTPSTTVITPFVAASWMPELDVLVRVGTPELRFGGLSFLFATYFQVTEVQGWLLSPREAQKGATEELVNSVGIQFGISLRLRMGELKPYF